MAQQLSIQNITTFYKEGNPFVCKIFYQSIIKRNKRFKGVALEPYLPCFIVKKPKLIFFHQLTFFHNGRKHQRNSLSSMSLLKVNLIQNTAISFAVCRG
jgi:aspartate kinase